MGQIQDIFMQNFWNIWEELIWVKAFFFFNFNLSPRIFLPCCKKWTQKIPFKQITLNKSKKKFFKKIIFLSSMEQTKQMHLCTFTTHTRKKSYTRLSKVCFEIISIEIWVNLKYLWCGFFFTCLLIRCQPFKLHGNMIFQPCIVLWQPCNVHCTVLTFSPDCSYRFSLIAWFNMCMKMLIMNLFSSCGFLSFFIKVNENIFSGICNNGYPHENMNQCVTNIFWCKCVTDIF